MNKKILAVTFLVFALAPYAFGTCFLTYWTESLPDFQLNTFSSVSLDVCCGTPPYTFTITSGTLPAGLSLSSAGVISGTPTALADTTVYIKVSDSGGCDLTQAFAVRVTN